MRQSTKNLIAFTQAALLCLSIESLAQTQSGNYTPADESIARCKADLAQQGEMIVKVQNVINLCSDWNVRNVISTPSSSNPRISRQEYLTCITKVGTAAITAAEAMKKAKDQIAADDWKRAALKVVDACTNSFDIKDILSDEYDKCLVSFHKYFPYVYNDHVACVSRNGRERTNSPEFGICVNNLKNFGVDLGNQHIICSTDDRSFDSYKTVASQKYLTCVSNAQVFGYKKADAVNECLTYSMRSDFESSEIIPCKNKLDKFGAQDDIILAKCVKGYGGDARSLILSEKFDKCMTKVTGKSFWDSEALPMCLDKSKAETLATAEFDMCYSKLEGFGFKKALIMEKCLGPQSDLDAVVSSEFEGCFASAKNLKLKADQSLELCLNKKAHSMLGDQRFRSCLDLMKPFSGESLSTVSFCVDEGESMAAVNGNAKQCLEHLNKSSFKDFIKLSIEKAKKIKGKNFIVESLKQCSQNDAPTEQGALKLMLDINIHTDQKFAGSNERDGIYIGGISGLAFDQKNGILQMLSDSNPNNAGMFSGRISSKPPRILNFKFSFNNEQILLTEKDITYLEGRNKTSLSLDSESMVRFKNGSYLISSEVKGETKKLREMGLSYVNFFDSLGRFKDGLVMPTSYYEPPQDNKGSNDEGGFFDWFGGGGGGNSGRSGGGHNNGNSNNNNRGSQRNYSRGLVSDNRGIEGIALSPSENYIFLSNEDSLAQDTSTPTCKWVESKKNSGKVIGRHWDDRTQSWVDHYESSSSGGQQVCTKARQSIRLVSYQKNQDKYAYLAEYRYDLEVENTPGENGVSEILAISDNEILVLERAFDRQSAGVTARVFLVELKDENKAIPDVRMSSDNSKPLKKTLLLDLKNIIPKMTPGFKSLDNFEAMTIGPKLSNGHYTLLMATDNNFSDDQRTILLILEMNSELSEKVGRQLQ